MAKVVTTFGGHGMWGVLYHVHNMPLQLDGAYSDIAGVGVWPMSDKSSNTLFGQNLTVWLHTNATILTDTGALACARGLRTLTRIETYSQCAKMTGVRYVTIQRFSTSSTQLALQEVRVYRSSERERGLEVGGTSGGSGCRVTGSPP